MRIIKIKLCRFCEKRRIFFRLMSLIASTLIILVLTAGCVSHRMVPSAHENQNMLFALSLDKESYNPDDEIIALVTLKNVGKVPVYVNHRMALNFADLNNFGEVAFQIASPSNQDLEFTARVRIGFPIESDFMELKPNQAITETYIINKWYSPFDESGEYSIRAIYHNSSEAKSGVRTWTGEISSNLVEFTYSPTAR